MKMMSMKKNKKKSKLLKLDIPSMKNDDSSPKIGCFPLPTKGWNGVLKAASKHFKKSKKKRDSFADAKLLDFKY